ncbi:MAG: transcription repressor NadR [Lachnospiraceae bacterium]|nr:transcription repressor NadR [Lachnospiraceae bacterium]
MTGEERRKRILGILMDAEHPVSGDYLASELKVSRQVIVQDIALLRANQVRIYSTNRGYMVEKGNDAGAIRVFKVYHTDEETADEMNLIVDMGGRLEDVFVYHKMYGIMRGNLNVRSRFEVQKYIDELKTGKSTLLKNITGGYHYHTVAADSEEILDLIEAELGRRGFLAKLVEYEPVDKSNKRPTGCED